MKSGELWNLRTGQMVAAQLVIADSFWLRFRGLLGKSSLKHGEGLWLKGCQQVHMIGMKFPLSIWYLDNHGRVCSIIDNLKPWQIAPRLDRANSIIEFPEGWGELTNTRIGDEVQWR
ncbi:hypothetical protein DP73_09330 [Desulfosporosinus sp. HMP52]|uniref:DUF192 domain-containing protein n=1 Tax=Desulfosporosinus sp. HMP52 TaxID=1487923 RepID=UPI00051FB3DA|nr:DUF192 domain-containing protein [Desulfosporosinus sp. HMP52]KGK89824.1 hypothetical protein DP73_09330 [Desulfosporosinus sp. HMP52]